MTAPVIEGPGTEGTAVTVRAPQPQEPRIAALKKLPMVVRKELLASLPPADRLAIEHDWRLWARPKQLPPPGQWEVWFCCGGRGAGKSRTGAEFAHWKAETMPGSRGALIGATADDVRYTMVEGDSGLLAHMKPQNPVRYWPAKRLLRWKNGAQARTFTGEEPQRLRGPQHHWGWIDEWAAFKYPKEAWDQFMLGKRLGTLAQACVTTTPKPFTELVKIRSRTPFRVGIYAARRLMTRFLIG